MTRRHHRRGNGKPAGQRASWDQGQAEHGRDNVRAAIAHAAARLIAEGLGDYHAAKLKAARQIGVSDKGSLPDNQEIELALREHLALFQRDSQPPILQDLRETALYAMQWLSAFSPWLTGPVLSGTANAFSEIELELIGVEAKSLELFLLNEGVEFDTQERKDRALANTLRYVPEWNDAPLVITLFDNHAQRQVATPRDSLRQERVQRDEAEKRFADITKP